MKNVKKLLALGLAVVMTIGCLAGCGAKSADSSEDVDRLDKILADGKIRVGVNPPTEPTCFYDDEGNLIGYDLDWGNKLGEALGVEVEFVDVSADRIAAIEADRCDVVIATMTATLERAKTVDFTIPYLNTGIKVGVKHGLENEVKDLEDLNDPKYTIAIVSGTTGEALVLEQAPKANLVYVTSLTDQLLSIETGKADAILEDGIGIDYAAGGDKLVALEKVYTTDPLCIAYAKGSPEFARYMDLFVSTQISSGWMAETYYKWFGSEYTGTLAHPW